MYDECVRGKYKAIELSSVDCTTNTVGNNGEVDVRVQGRRDNVMELFHFLSHRHKTMYIHQKPTVYCGEKTRLCYILIFFFSLRSTLTNTTQIFRLFRLLLATSYSHCFFFFFFHSTSVIKEEPNRLNTESLSQGTKGWKHNRIPPLNYPWSW